MIRVIKSQPPPTPLVRRGATHLAKLKIIQEADPVACRASRNNLLASKDGIYNDARVKNQLRADQHGKCCYCEWVPTDSYGDVEHFRPKGGVQQVPGEPVEKPGYYWLAYEWSNLYFACIYCNQKYKGNYFPLRDPAARACSHAANLSAEQPLLVDPATEDPALHLTFKQDAVEALDERGTSCIEVFGLDRPELINRRIKHLKLLKLAKWVSQLDMSVPLNAESASFLRQYRFTLEEGKTEVALAKEDWGNATLDSAEFAGMVRAARLPPPTVWPIPLT